MLNTLRLRAESTSSSVSLAWVREALHQPISRAITLTISGKCCLSHKMFKLNYGMAFKSTITVA